jgi:uncharacterized protein (TIGR00369 family)
LEKLMPEQENFERSRSYSWEDPGPASQAGRGLSGLEYIQKLVKGEFPQLPMAVTLGFNLVEAEYGRAVFEVTPAEYHYNPIGTVHGGLASTLLDSALGCAVHTTLPARTGYTTLELHVNFIRPLTAKTGPLRCEGKVLHSGKQIATAEAKLYDETGKLYAHATTTCLVFTPKPSA